MSRVVAMVAIWLLVTAMPGMGSAGTVSAQTSERCFAETGLCISGRIREFWEQNGGLPVFGLPLGPQQQLQSDGRTVEAQWFERHRIELHPENARPYDVLLGRLGGDLLEQQGRDWHAFPASEPQPGCRSFPETGHNLCGDFLAAWRASGVEVDGRPGTTEAESLALFGLPLSDQVQEEIEGREYTVQWFERARFELHPENQPPYRVLFGLLGTEVHGPPSPIQPAPPPSQGTAAVSGSVIRESGSPVAGAIVELGSALRTQTDSQGKFRFTAVQPGSTILYVELGGCQFLSTVSNLRAGERRVIDVKLPNNC
jgi:hypothetical protein